MPAVRSWQNSEKGFEDKMMIKVKHVTFLVTEVEIQNLFALEA